MWVVGWLVVAVGRAHWEIVLLPDNPQDYVLVRIISVIYLTSGKFSIKLCS